MLTENQILRDDLMRMICDVTNSLDTDCCQMYNFDVSNAETCNLEQHTLRMDF